MANTAKNIENILSTLNNINAGRKATRKEEGRKYNNLYKEGSSYTPETWARQYRLAAPQLQEVSAGWNNMTVFFNRDVTVPAEEVSSNTKQTLTVYGPAEGKEEFLILASTLGEPYVSESKMWKGQKVVKFAYSELNSNGDNVWHYHLVLSLEQFEYLHQVGALSTTTLANGKTLYSLPVIVGPGKTRQQKQQERLIEVLAEYKEKFGVMPELK
jgi:hypothetical protein